MHAADVLPHNNDERELEAKSTEANVVVAQWRPPHSFPNAKSWVPHSSQSHRDEWDMLPPILKSYESEGHGFSRAANSRREAPPSLP